CLPGPRLLLQPRVALLPYTTLFRSSRGLVFGRLLQVAGALARLGDQPRVLHRDDRLRREILQQRDLLLRERPHLLAIHNNCTQEIGRASWREEMMRMEPATPWDYWV